ncbi:Telomere zinc finger-associated protein [Frankliniella fusca]|uniref:Telomere zinc finger-associated protein n=1 Tax=Frankliniella fusca TaxID=407009 RepID=A0AAE1LB70_9NEOP|nr:Telomere zinc finger-associated protein [Frankliniella fusca]
MESGIKQLLKDLTKMGVSVEQWRMRIGLFTGAKLIGGKCYSPSYQSTLLSVLLGNVVMIMALLLVVSKINHVDPTLVTPDFLYCKQTIFRSVFILLLLKRVLCHYDISTWNLMATLAAASVISSLLTIGNIETNPGPYPCQLCSMVPETIASSVRHQHSHSMNSNFLYYCPSLECKFTTSSFGSMNNHVSQYHRKTKHQEHLAGPDTPHYFCCVPDCSKSASSTWDIVQHYYQHLKSEVPIPKCPVPDCKFKHPFTKVANLRVHMSQTHSGWLDEGCVKKRKLSNESVTFNSVPSSCPSTSTVEDEVMDSGNMEESEAVPEAELNEDPQILNDELVMDCIAKFYLRLYGKFFLPYNVIQEISEGIALLSSITHSRIKLLLTEELKKLKVEEKDINLIKYKIMCSDLLYASHSKDIPGPTLTSDFLRKRYFQKNFNFKPPTEVRLDMSSGRTNKKFQYVPVRETLETVLEDPTVQKEIDISFQPLRGRQDGIMSNYTDGQQFKSENHPRKEIQVFLFQDGFNPVLNVLGSAKNKYKDLAVYFTIANLNPSLRSKVSSKHLVMIIRESVIKSVGINKCFQKLRDDLADLERNGIMLKSENIKVVVEYGIGDNLGQHFIGGFVQSFSGTYCCRFCNVKRKIYKRNPTVTCSLRTRDSYRRCVFRSRLLGKPYHGIKEDSIFNTLKYFHSATHLVPCCAHDILEGVISWDLSGIIASLVKSKFFSYNLLNRRIKNFRCSGADAPNKPACVNVKGQKLGGHAVQNWTLLRILPFIIGDFYLQ